jgi:hypothetical protein
MNIEPKDSFWSVITSPFRLVGVIFVSIFATPLFIMRKIWSPHLDAANGCSFKEVYMFIRFGDYKRNDSDYDY